MSNFDPHYHLRPPTAKTVRESRLEALLLAALPYLAASDIIDQRSEKMRALVESIVVETTKGHE